MFYNKLSLNKVLKFDLFEYLWNKWQAIPPEYKFGYLGGVIAGLFAHGFLLCNFVINEDGHGQLKTDFLSRSNLYWKSGRWLIAYCMSLHEGYMFPFVLIALALLLLPLAGCLNAAIWRLQNRWAVFALAAFHVTFPAYASAFSYQYFTLNYACASLLGVLAVYYADKARLGPMVGGALFLCLSLSLYQAQIAMTASLCLLTLVLRITGSIGEAVPSVVNPALVKRALTFLGHGVLGCVLYLLSIKFFKAIHPHEKMFDYRGMNQIGILDLSSLKHALAAAYRGFWQLLHGVYFLMPSYMVWTITLLLAAASGAMLVRCWRRPGSAAQKSILLGVTLVLLALVPPVALITCILAPKTEMDILQTFGLIVVVGAGVAALCKSRIPLMRSLAFVASLLLIWGFVLRSNAINLKGYLYTQASFFTANRILARIESTPGYNENSRVAFVGYLPNPLVKATNALPFTEPSRGFFGGPVGVTQSISQLETVKFANQSATIKFANILRFMDYRLRIAHGDDDFNLAVAKAADMPAWPAAQSIQAFGDLIVVNLSFDAQLIKDVNVEKLDKTTCRITATLRKKETRPCEFAWYIFEGSQRIDKMWYNQSNRLDYKFPKKGTYKILVFARPVGSSSDPAMVYSPVIEIN